MATNIPKVDFTYKRELFTKAEEKSLSRGRNHLLAFMTASGKNKKDFGFDYNDMNQFIPHSCVIMELTSKSLSYAESYMIAASIALGQHSSHLFADDKRDMLAITLIKCAEGAAKAKIGLCEFILTTELIVP